MENFISKLEEAESLDYIRKKLIPIAANSWNTGFAADFHGENHLVVTSEMISKNLKKVYHTHFIHIGGDQIEWHSFLKNPKDPNFNAGFRFVITKYIDGSIVADWSHSHNKGQSLIIKKPKLNEEEEKEKIDLTLTKMDVDRALIFINREVIPFIVDEIYNRILKQYPKISSTAYPRIGYSTLRKHLKRIHSEKTSVVYQTHVGGGDYNYKNPTFTLVIFKDEYDNGRLTVLVKHESGSGVNNRKIQVREQLVIKEESENPQDLVITPQEEHEAKRIIARHLVPVYVNNNNWWVRHDKEVGLSNTQWDGKVLDLINNREVILGMKKVKNDSNLKIFKFEKGRSEMYFAIRKDYFYPDDSDVPEITFAVGTRDGQAEHIWDSKKKTWVDDLTRGWSWRYYNKDKKEWDVYLQESKLKENINLNLYAITKLDEDYAVQFIKKNLIPKLVDFVNDTSRHFTRQRQITIQEVLKTFKKMGHYNHSKLGYTREITYQALFLGEPFEFDIFKENGSLYVLQKSDGTTHRIK